MEKSRFMVWEMISRKWKGDFLISPKNRDGGEDLHLLLEMVMHEHSLIFFFFFFPFSSFSSPFFLSYCSSLEERERGRVWNEWVGESVGVSWFCWSCYTIHADMWVQMEGEEDRSSKLNLLKKWLGTWSVGSLDGLRDHWFWENWFRERGLI